MANEASKELCYRWIALWNGDLALAHTIIAPAFTGHFAPMGSDLNEIRGPEALKEAIEMTLKCFSGVQVTIEVGPLADEDKVVDRWIFRGIYQGGIPGVPSEARGRSIAFQGIDILRIEGNQISECWISSNGLHLMHQLGAHL